MADEWWKNYKFVVILCVAGLLSGFITAAFVFRFGKHGMYTLGGLFGAIMADALVVCGLLRGLWKAILLIAVSAVAFLSSWYAAGVVELGLDLRTWSMGQAPTNYPVSMFAGGAVGGFIVLAAISVLVYPKLGMRTLAVKTVVGSLVGGILGVVGWWLGPSLGMVIWSGVHDLGLTSPKESFWNALSGDTKNAYSLFVVWQTGMALVLAFVLWPYETKSRDGS